MTHFKDENFEPVEFKSSWMRERLTSFQGVQTEELPVNEKAVQSLKRKDAETQTDAERRGSLEMAKTDLSKLTQFLRRVEPLFLHYLSKNAKSRAFEGYRTGPKDESYAVTCVHTLSHAELKEELQVTGLSWNSTGSVIAATFGRFDHEDWCTHRSALATWNLDRRSVNPTKPDTVIDSPCCLMCVAFHPTNPALIAAGNFNGEVLVWDLSREDDLLLVTSGIGNDAHREPVSKVAWMNMTDKKKNIESLMSVSGDGKMLVWKMDIKKQKIKLSSGFVLMTQSLPRGMKVRGVRGDKEVGVTSVAFSHEDREMFIIGSESGCLFKCSLHALGNPAGSHIVSSVPLHSPVTFTYRWHDGPVHSVDFSPFHRSAFLSSGMDQSLRIYNTLQAGAVLNIEPGEGYLYSSHWSPTRPAVLATVTEMGNLLIYDLHNGQLLPVARHEAGHKKCPVYTLQFNRHQRHLVATGDGLGYIKVFKLGEELTSLAPRESETLDTLITAAMD